MFLDAEVMASRKSGVEAREPDQCCEKDDHESRFLT
jgi:hypothetical protein